MVWCGVVWCGGVGWGEGWGGMKGGVGREGGEEGVPVARLGCQDPSVRLLLDLSSLRRRRHRLWCK